MHRDGVQRCLQRLRGRRRTCLQKQDPDSERLTKNVHNVKSIRDSVPVWHEHRGVWLAGMQGGDRARVGSNILESQHDTQEDHGQRSVMVRDQSSGPTLINMAMTDDEMR